MENNSIWVSGIGAAADSFHQVEIAAIDFAEDSEAMKKTMEAVKCSPIAACGTISGVVDFSNLSELARDCETAVEMAEEKPKVNRQTSFGGLFNKKGNRRW